MQVGPVEGTAADPRKSTFEHLKLHHFKQESDGMRLELVFRATMRGMAADARGGTWLMVGPHLGSVCMLWICCCFIFVSSWQLFALLRSEGGKM